MYVYIYMCIIYIGYIHTLDATCVGIHTEAHVPHSSGVSTHTRRTSTVRVHTMYTVFAKHMYTCTRIFPLKQNPKTSTHTPPLACAGSYTMHPKKKYAPKFNAKVST